MRSCPALDSFAAGVNAFCPMSAGEITPQMPLDYRDLVLRFEEIKHAYAQAKSTEERRKLLTLAWEVVRQAEEVAAQFRSEIDQLQG